MLASLERAGGAAARARVRCEIDPRVARVFHVAGRAGRPPRAAAGIQRGSGSVTRWWSSTWRQRERDDAVVGHRVAEEAAAGGRDDDVLPAVAAFVGHRRRLRRARQLVRPQLLAGLRVERAEAAVVGRADEDQPAGGRDRAAVAGTAGLLLVRRQALGDPERHAPGELAGVHVDRGQLSPRRLLADIMFDALSLKRPPPGTPRYGPSGSTRLP